MLEYDVPLEFYAVAIDHTRILRYELLDLKDQDDYITRLMLAICETQENLLNFNIEMEIESLPIGVRSAVLIGNRLSLGIPLLNLYMDFCNDGVFPCFDVPRVIYYCKEDKNIEFFKYITNNFYGADFIVDEEWEEDFRTYLWKSYLEQEQELIEQ